MVWIRAPKDDYSVREIQRKNASSSAVGASRDVQEVQKKDLLQRESVPIRRQAPVQERRRTDRRKGDRRQQQQPVLLDTRSNRDRRRTDRRQTKLQRKASKGFDYFC